MCDPVSIGLAVGTIGVGKAVAGHIGQNQAASANKKAANYNYAQDVQTLGQKGVELDQEKSENAFDTAIAAAQSQGRITASATDQGLAPTSIAQALNADMFGIGRQASLEDLNDQNARIQLSQEGAGADIKRQNQIMQKPRAGALSLVLGVGEGITSGFQAAGAAKGK